MRRAGNPGCIGSITAVRSRAWIWDFSSTHSTTAFSGGARYNPTMSVTFATSSGSVLNLKVCSRHGCTPTSRHALATVPLDVFNLAASSRDDQWVTPRLFGGVRKVAAMIASRSTVRGRPDRASSTSPAIPDSSYLLRHNVTVGRETPTRAAIAVLETPSAASSTILARCANSARIDDDRTHDNNRCSSPGRSTSATNRMCHYPSQGTGN